MFSRGSGGTIVLIRATQVFQSSSWPSLKSLKDRLVLSNAKKDLIRKHDGALTLLQFYNHELHCFTSQDHQIVPTLEKYSRLFKIIEHTLVTSPNMHDFETITEALYLGLDDMR